MSEKRSKFHGLFPIEVEQPAATPEPLNDQPPLDDSGSARASRNSRNQELSNSRNQDTKKSRNQESGEVVRLKTNYEIRQDYHRKLKNIANDEGRKMYQVIEEAIGRYLKSKGRL